MIEKTHWRRVAAILLAGVAVALHIGKVPPSIPLLSGELHLDLVAAGWLLSLLAAMGALGGSAVGQWVERLGYRRSLLTGLGCTTMGSVIGALSQDALWLLSSRTLESAGSVMVIVSAPALIWRETRAEDQRLAFGMWGCWMPVGTAAMMALSPTLLTSFGWRANWLAAAAVSLTALAVARLTLSADLPASPQHAKAGLGTVLGLPQAWMLTGSFCFYSMSFMSVFGFLPVFLVNEQHLAPGWVVRLTALAILANAAGNLMAGWLARYGLPRWSLIAIACLGIGLTPWGIFSGMVPVTGRYALCIVFAVTGGLLPATVFSAVPAVAPTRAQVAPLSGMLVQGSSIGQLIGPPMLGLLVQTLGSWTMAPIFFASTGAAGICLALAFRGSEQAAADPARCLS